MLRQDGPGVLLHNVIVYIITTVIYVKREQHELVVVDMFPVRVLLAVTARRARLGNSVLCQTVHLNSMPCYALAAHKVTSGHHLTSWLTWCLVEFARYSVLSLHDQPTQHVNSLLSPSKEVHHIWDSKHNTQRPC